MGFQIQIHLILCFSRSILVKFCVICERAKVKRFFQRRIYLKNIDRFDIDLSPLDLTFVVGEVLKEISLLRSDCSTGVDQIPVKYVKQVGDFPTIFFREGLLFFLSLKCGWNVQMLNHKQPKNGKEDNRK